MSRTHHPKFRQKYKNRYVRERNDQRTRLIARLSLGNERVRGRRRSRKVRDLERWVDNVDFTRLLRERLITEPPWRPSTRPWVPWGMKVVKVIVRDDCEP